MLSKEDKRWMQETCDKYKIKLLNYDQACRMLLRGNSGRLYTLHKQAISKSGYVFVGEDIDAPPRFVLLHEVGHAKHPLGYSAATRMRVRTHNLTPELAANAWALDNLNGLNFDEGLLVYEEQLLAYINMGVNKAVSTPELLCVASALNVFDKIQWVKL